MRLSEMELATEHGVSRTPVREALKLLQSEGLVEIRPRAGTFVLAPSRRDLIELFDLKGLLEGAAARLLAARGSCSELELLDENIVQAKAAANDSDSGRYAALVEIFHGTLVRGSGNERLISVYGTLMNQLAYSQLVHLSLLEPGRLAQSCKEHEDVVELIRSRDGDTAEQKMRYHVSASRRALFLSAAFAS